MLGGVTSDCAGLECAPANCHPARPARRAASAARPLRHRCRRRHARRPWIIDPQQLLLAPLSQFIFLVSLVSLPIRIRRGVSCCFGVSHGPRASAVAAPVALALGAIGFARVTWVWARRLPAASKLGGCVPGRVRPIRRGRRGSGDDEVLRAARRATGAPSDTQAHNQTCGRFVRAGGMRTQSHVGACGPAYARALDAAMHPPSPSCTQADRKLTSGSSAARTVQGRSGRRAGPGPAARPRDSAPLRSDGTRPDRG